ncbi:non-ribosomal peptide synthetase [Streptomyces afghaniensis]|uniref:non-ribosomal peptide synthetase n=1 Tax=Streptomyces afghaniensis TaxID=66865 RepID=UPI0027854234|nr:non-ribosomal peptide synthetase [Streptomyces afghaniensis]MDQ1015677.1 amino acid adenylation domain-containing protein [Streptomyces afghaniensis]
MRILHTLVGSELGRLGQEIAEYLADAGHVVWMLDEDPVGPAEWRARMTHNTKVIKEDTLSGRRLDYVVGSAVGAARRPDLPVLAPELQAFGPRPEARCTVRLSRGDALVSGATAVGDPHGAVLDACVDGLIRLSREGHASLALEPRQKCPDDLPELLRMEHAADLLAARARAADRAEDRFDLAETIGSDIAETSGKREVLHFRVGSRSSLTPDRLELLSLVVQMVLNSRKCGTYVHDLNTPTGRIRKYLNADRHLRHRDLLDRLHDPLYESHKNAFYEFDALFSETRPSRVLVDCDGSADSGDALLVLRYRGDGGRLEVEAPAGLPFLAVLRAHVDAFLARLDGFEREDSAALGDLLSLPGTLRAEQTAQAVDIRVPFDERPLHHLVEEQAARQPAATAVVHDGTTLSYREFNEAANRFARLLRDRHGPRPGDLIALYLDRTEHLLIAAMAVLKLGCAYVPLDLGSPARRTAAILADSRPVLIVSDTAHHAGLDDSAAGIPVVAADADDVQAAAATRDGADLDVPVTGSDLAYVIYTSGTTGRPKGVAVEHRSFLNIAQDIGRCVGFRRGERMLAVTTVAFDISTLELYMPLLHGGTVVLAGRADLLDVARLVELIEDGVSVVQATPSLWHLITQNLGGRRLPVRALCGGEALPAQLADVLVATVEQCWNVYGPTETTVWSTRRLLTPDDSRPLIGIPVANTRCYVLDEELQPLPPGVVGELCIAGAGLARGYLNSPELTASRFVTPPPATDGTGPAVPEERLYRTGDLVRALPDGELEFIGRNDFQIKLRGHRIELGEIESALASHPAVEQSLVLVHEPPRTPGDLDAPADDARYLVAYYVAPEPPDQDELQRHLAGLLPDYMRPTVLVPLESMPLNANGKTDRGALPDPGQFLTGGYVAPDGELETRLCELWAEVLDGTGGTRRTLGVTDDFFRSGGNSILGIKLVNRINVELGCDIRIRDVFREKTVRRLAPLVAASLGGFAYRDHLLDGTDTDHLYEPFPLTNVQQTYYLGRFHNFELSNVSTHVYSEFRYGSIDHERLETAFNRLVERHLALRTVFTDGQQRFLREVPHHRIPFHELRDEAELEELRGAYAHKLYDPEQYPLFDIVLSRLDGVFRLHISFDALVIDMASFDILFDEWAQLYADPQRCLPDLGVSYRDYVLQYEKVRDSDLLLRARQYWEDKADDYQLDLRLPLRAHPSSVDTPVFRRKSRVVPAAVWEKLADRCRHHGISPTALVTELFGRVLGHWSGQDRLCVNLTLFNRLPLHPDVNGVIGDFTVLELFDHRTEHGTVIAETLRRVHGDLLRDIEHNLFDGVDFQRLLKTRHSMPVSKITAPVVLTSTLGAKTNASMFELVLDDTYQGVDHAISQTPQVWLDNKAYETDEGFVAEWDYVEQLFEPAVLDAMHDAYCRLIEELAELDWDTAPFPSLPVPAEDLALVEAANATGGPVCEDTLFGLYESRLDDGRRDAVAVVDAATGRSHTYGELYEDSTTLARALLASGALPEGPRVVGVLAEKGYLQVVGTLGVMKTGGTYVPLNAEWPGGRLAEVLGQAGAGVVLVSRGQASRPEVAALGGVCRVLVVEDLLAGGVPEVVLPRVGPDDVAYVIFTSGSTGRPKGVTVSHRGAVNTLVAVNDRFGVGCSDRVLALSELSFDLSVYDLFGVLAAGGAIVFPVQGETKNPAHWLELVRRHGVTVWNSVPQLAGLLADEAGDVPGGLESLRAVLLSGDWIPTQLPGRLRRLAPGATVMSLGGATEGSVWSVWFEVGRVDPGWASIPYGTAMPGQRMYVLNGGGEHCPVGVVGEIHIGGAGVALGYWRDEERTAERFFEHPVLGRLYRTGDLGRWTRQGWIEFIGRNDFQVKLNGYRVELEEIAAKLSRLPGVDKAVARVQKDDTQDRLVAYLVPAPEHAQRAEAAEQGADKHAFVMSAPGLLDTVAPRLALEFPRDQAAYARAKSYRHFLDAPVDPGLVRKRFAEVTAPAAGTGDGTTHLRPEDLAAVLGVLSAASLPGRALPKYRYPSAGSTYPVRTFLRTPEDAGHRYGGHLYFHPLTGELGTHGLDAVAAWPGDHGSELQLVVHWPAISPLYADRSRRLALLEAGHMLALLTEALDARGIPYRVVPEERPLDAEHTGVCRIVLGTTGGFRPSPLELGCQIREADGTEFAEPGGSRRYDLAAVPLFDRTGEAHAVLARARCLLTLDGAATPEHLLSAGFLFQRLAERLRADGLGTCPLGLTPTDGGVYALAVGAVDEEARQAPDSPAEPPTLTEVVTGELARALPDYMVPTGYRVLDALPLSANGKLAADRLPLVETKGTYVAPATATERALAEVWATVLGRPADTVGTTDSFFAVGGNSLAAMRLVRLLQRDLGSDLKLRDLYANDTILKLAEHMDTAPADAVREEGEL